MQGRLFSYLDTQLKRLGGPNFHQIPINAPKCPFANLQRDVHMQMLVPKGSVNYGPNSLDPAGPRETPAKRFVSFAAEETGSKLRIRPESFADHYTQARLFFASQTEPEQNHIVAALIFELSKVETPAIRARVVSHLLNIDTGLARRVSSGLGLATVSAAKTAVTAQDMDASPALSILGNAEPTLKGRTIGLLVGAGADVTMVAALQKAVKGAGANAKIIGENIAGVALSDGTVVPVDFRIDGGPSCLFDAVAILGSDKGIAHLASMAPAQDFVRDAFAHLKVILATPNTTELFSRAGLSKAALDDGCLTLAKRADVAAFVEKAAKGRIWQREPKLRPLPAA
jgi:catalase